MHTQALTKSKHVNSYARGYATKLKEQQLKVGMSLMVEVEKVLQVGAVWLEVHAHLSLMVEIEKVLQVGAVWLEVRAHLSLVVEVEVVLQVGAVWSGMRVHL